MKILKTLELVPVGTAGTAQFMAKLRGYSMSNDYPKGSTITYTGTGTALRAQAGTVNIVSPWIALTSYQVGNFVQNGGNIYECITAGQAAASPGPSGFGTDILDGAPTTGAHWAYSQAGPGGSCHNDEPVLNGEISNIQIRFLNAAPTNGRAIDICLANQFYLNNVTVTSSSVTLLPGQVTVGDLATGIRCRGCGIGWFDKLDLAGFPTPPGTYIRDGILLTGNPGVGAGGALWIDRTNWFFTRRAVHLVGTTGATWIHPVLGITNYQADSVGTFLYVDNTVGPMILDEVRVDNGRQTHESLQVYADMSAVAIDETGPNSLQLQLYYEHNEHSCFGDNQGNGGCSVTQTTAVNGLSRTLGNATITATVAESCVRFRVGNKVYKTGATDTNAPGGMKNVSMLCTSAAGCPTCTPFDSNIWSNCTAYSQPLSANPPGVGAANVCAKFQYTSAYDTATTAFSTGPAAVFDAGDYPVNIFSSNSNAGAGGAGSSSNLELNIKDNDFSGWSRGGWRFYSVDAQTAPPTGGCVLPNCNITTLNWTHNRVQDNTSTGLGNPYPVLRNALQVGAGTSGFVWGIGSGTDGYTLPEIAGVTASKLIPSQTLGDGVTFTAAFLGVIGNLINVTYSPTSGTTTTVSVSGNNITVNPKTGETNAGVVTAVQTSALASTLVSVAAVVGGDPVIAVTQTFLTGGITNLREGHISIAPINTVAQQPLAYQNVIHTLLFARATFNGASPAIATFRIPDYQDFCTCTDLTATATVTTTNPNYLPVCTRDNNTFINSNIANIQGTCTATGANGLTNILDCRCW